MLAGCVLTIGMDSVGLIFERKAESACKHSVMVDGRLQSRDKQRVEERRGAERSPVFTKTQPLTELCRQRVTKFPILQKEESLQSEEVLVQLAVCDKIIQDHAIHQGTPRRGEERMVCGSLKHDCWSHWVRSGSSIDLARREERGNRDKKSRSTLFSP